MARTFGTRWEASDLVRGAHLTELDPDYLWGWFKERIDGIRPPLTVELLLGGKSNLTFRVTDGREQAWALRRPPRHGVLDSAHDMGREFHIISALQESAIPVPGVVGYDDGAAAPFYVTHFIEGSVIRDRCDAAALSVEARRRLGFALVDLLAAVHKVEPETIWSERRQSSTPYVRRQLRRWLGQWHQQATRDLPQVGAIHDRLESLAPLKDENRLVHGDFKLANTLVTQVGAIRSLLDWELCTVGDPAADLGLFLAYWPDRTNASNQPLLAEAAPTQLPGFPSQRELVERYAAVTGRSVPRISYYIAFAYWKLALILENVHTRWRSGAYGDDDTAHSEVRNYPGSVVRLLGEADEMLSEGSPLDGA